MILKANHFIATYLDFFNFILDLFSYHLLYISLNILKIAFQKECVSNDYCLSIIAFLFTLHTHSALHTYESMNDIRMRVSDV